MAVARLTLALALTLATLACGSEGASLSVDPSPSPVASHVAADPADPADCPQTQAERSVPAQPAGFDGTARLVPAGMPDSALLCEYSDGRLVRGVALAGDLAPVGDELALPIKYGSHACTAIGRVGPLMSYLLRIEVGDATAWVQSESDPNGCTETSNGSFASDAYEADVLAAWLKAGTWTPQQPRPDASPTPCQYLGAGRPGDERSLLPGTPTHVRACSETSYRDLTEDEVTELQRVLDAVKTQPSTNGCQGTPVDPVDVSATYAEGRPSILRFMPGCEPSLDNGFVAGTPTAEQRNQLDHLLRPPGG